MSEIESSVNISGNLPYSRCTSSQVGDEKVEWPRIWAGAGLASRVLIGYKTLIYSGNIIKQQHDLLF